MNKLTALNLVNTPYYSQQHLILPLPAVNIPQGTLFLKYKFLSNTYYSHDSAVNSKHYKTCEYSLKYLNTPGRPVNILLKREHPIILLFPLCTIVLKHLKGYENKNNNNNNNNNDDKNKNNSSSSSNNNKYTERMFREMKILQITKRINTPSVLNTDLLNIKLRVTHLSLQHPANRTHKLQQLENHSTKYHRQQPLYNTLGLLMMGIVVSETC